MIGWMLDQAVGWLSDFVTDTLNSVWTLLVATLFHLPDVTGLPQVQELTARSLNVVNIGYGLFIMAAGTVAMTHGSVQLRYSAQELLPRLCFGIVAANFGTWIARTVIEAGNALVVALTGDGIASQDTLKQLLRNLLNELKTPGVMLLGVVIGLLIDVLVILLLVGWIVRFAILIVLCGTAPIALACHGLPWTEPVAKLWWKALGGVVATVVLQAIALHTSLSIWLTPSTNLAGIGWPIDTDGILNLLVVAVLLWVTVRIPGLVRQQIGGGGRPNVLGMIVRLVIVQQLTRGLGGFVRGAGRAGGAGGAGRALGAGGPAGSGGPGGPPTPNRILPYWRPRRPTPAATSNPAGGNPSTGGRPARSPGPGSSSTASRSPGQGPAPAGQARAAGAAGTGRRPLPTGGLPGGGMPSGVNPRTVFGDLSPASQPAPRAAQQVAGRALATGASGGTGWPGSARATAARTAAPGSGRVVGRGSGTGWPSNPAGSPTTSRARPVRTPPPPMPPHIPSTNRRPR